MSIPSNCASSKTITSGKLEACSWETPWTKAMATVKDVGKKAEELSKKIQDWIDSVHQAVNDYKNSFSGKVINFATAGAANRLIDAIFNALKSFVNIVGKLIKAISDIIPKILAPWVIRSVGEQMQSPFVGKVTTFSDSLAISNLVSPTTWISPASKEWQLRATEQHDKGGQPLKEGAKAFADATTELGQRGVTATEKFAKEVTSGILGIWKAAKDLSSIVKLLPALIKGASIAFKVISLIWAFVKFVYEIIDSSSDFQSASSKATAFEWPQSTNA